jgi:hypothetical protein
VEVPFRTLTDYWFAFHNVLSANHAISPEPVQERLITALFGLFQEAVMRDPALGAGQWRHLTADLSVDRDGNWSLPIGSISIRASLANQHKLSIPKEVGAVPYTQNVYLASTDTGKCPWQLGPSPPPQLFVAGAGQPPVVQAGTPTIIAPAVQRLMVLYTDLQTLHNSYAKRNTLLPADLNNYSFAASEWIKGSTVVQWPWPFPPIGTYWEYELFVNGWGRTIPLLAGLATGNLLPSVAFSWIDLGVAILSGGDPQGIPGSEELRPDDWAELGDRLVRLLREAVANGPAGVDFREWLAQLPTILGPENLGEQKAVWRALGSVRDLVGFWKDHAGRFLAQLRARLQQQQFEELVNSAKATSLPWMPRERRRSTTAGTRARNRSRQGPATA